MPCGYSGARLPITTSRSLAKPCLGRITMSEPNNSRREFLHATLAGAAAAGLTGAAAGADDGKGLPTRLLGKTGVRVSILALGGWHIGSVKDENEAVKIMHAAIDEGLTFFDNAWDYP